MIDRQKITTDALEKIKNEEMKLAMRLAEIKVYKHVHEMLELGCEGKELSAYIAGCIRLECSRLPKDLIK